MHVTTFLTLVPEPLDIFSKKNFPNVSRHFLPFYFLIYEYRFQSTEEIRKKLSPTLKHTTFLSITSEPLHIFSLNAYKLSHLLIPITQKKIMSN